MSDGSYLDDVHQDIAEFAERHLEEDERDDFIDQLLERKGYVRQSTWAPPDPQQGGGGQGQARLLRPGQRGGQRRPAGQGSGGQQQGQGQRSYFRR